MAVTTQTRETGAVAKIVHSHSNDWEDFAGIDINVEAVYSPIDVTEGDWDIAHWSYRGQAAMCQLANGNIVRVRIGDWTATSERRIQRQIITDPTDPSQWQTWSWLAYGDNYAVAIERDDVAGAGYRIYHAKSDGLYMDNASVVTGGAAPWQIVRIKPVYGKTNMVYFAHVDQASDGLRRMTWWYIANTLSPGVPQQDVGQFGQYHHDMVAAKNSVWMQRYRAMPLEGGERSAYISDSLTSEYATTSAGYDEESEYNTYQNVRHLKGPSQRSGFKHINDLYITNIANDEFPDGAWYLFYTEQHLDVYGNVLSNLKRPLFWHRAASSSETGHPFFWSQAVPLGYTIWGFAGVEVSGEYIYLAGNGRVLRLLLDPTETDISDYLIEGGYELPRENGKANGRLSYANPSNYIGELLGMSSSSENGPLTERKLKFGIGLRRPDEADFTFKRDAEWWISGIRKYVTEDHKQQIELEISDFWHRLENPFRDTWQIPGKFEWSDWQPDADNKLENYSNDTDEITEHNPAGQPESTVPRLRTVASGDGPVDGSVTLFAGYRDTNGLVSCFLWAAGGIVFRYMDSDDFYVVYCTTTGTYLHRVTDATSGSSIGNSAFAIDYSTSEAAKIDTTNGTFLSVSFTWNRIDIEVGNDVDGTIIMHTLLPDIYTGLPQSGFVGFYTKTLIEISNVQITQPHALITSRELLRMLLAYVGEHEVQFESEEETLSAPQIDMLYGPQSDLDTPEKGVRQLLETARLNIVWRED